MVLGIAVWSVWPVVKNFKTAFAYGGDDGIITWQLTQWRHGFQGNIFYPYTELLLSNATENIEFTVPTKLVAGTDIKVSAIGLTGFSGAVTVVLRGWTE